MQRAASSSLVVLSAALILASSGCEDKPTTETAPSATPSAMLAPRELEVVPAALPKPPEVGTLPLPAMSAADLPKPATSAAASADTKTPEAPKAAGTQAAGAKTDEPPSALRKSQTSPGPMAPRGAATE